MTFTFKKRSSDPNQAGTGELSIFAKNDGFIYLQNEGNVATLLGGMDKTIYDPQNISDDAFNTDNHTNGVTNRTYSAAEKTKLSGIESGATGDQTGAEIKTLYESELDTNAFTDAEKTKLGTVESGATADQTGAEIKSLYEAQANTNAFTDAEKTKLAGAEEKANKGVANGYAPLDSNSDVPLVNLPASVKTGYVVADIAARDAIAAIDRYEGMRVDVLDASADPTVDAGLARYILTQPLTNSGWVKTSEGESMDIDFTQFISDISALSDLPQPFELTDLAVIQRGATKYKSTEIAKLMNNTIYLSSEQDLIDFAGAPVGGKITLLPNIRYEIVNTFVKANEWVFPTNGKVMITSTGGVIGVSSLINAGSITCFSSSDLGAGQVLIESLQIIGNSGAIPTPDGIGMDISTTDVTGQSAVIFDKVTFLNFGQVANITSVPTALARFNCIIYGNGITLNSVPELLLETLALRGSAFGGIPGNTHLTIQGTSPITGIGAFSIAGGSMVIRPGEVGFDIKSDAIIPDTSVSDFTVSNLSGTIFEPGSRTQENKDIDFKGCRDVPDSTATAKQFYEGNTLTTTINSIGVPEVINAIYTPGGIEERLEYQDECTFDSVLDTINTTYTHNLSNGDVISFNERDGLPAELVSGQRYFVVSASATSFQVESTIGGGSVDFSDNGTGINYFRHSTGNTKGWIIFVGNQPTKIYIDGWASLQKVGSGEEPYSLRLIKTLTNFTEVQTAPGSTISITSTKPQSSSVTDIILLNPEEGIKIAVENKVDTDDVDSIDSYFTYHLV